MNVDQKGILYIKKRSLTEWLTCLVFIFPYIIAFLFELIMLPSFFKYLVDFALLLITFSLFLRKKIIFNKENKPLFIYVLVFFIYTLIIFLFYFESPFYYIWGFRNTFRLYFAIFAFIFFFDDDDCAKGLKFLDFLFWFNAILSVFQFFVLNLKQDYLGGIFGTDRGCNGYTIVFFSIVITKSMLSFMSKKESILLCFSKCATSFIVAALAELKVYFVIFAFILIMCFLITKFSIRKLVLFFTSFALMMVGSVILVAVFGSKYQISVAKILEFVTDSNYATTEDLGRFTAIPTIANTILTEPHEQLFGLGLGNCDTSAIPVFNTPFFENYEMLHYTWFSSAFLFLETGYIGLLLYISFFVICFITALKRLKSEGSNELYCKLSMVISMISVILIFYNSTLRTEVVYMLCFALALPFADRLTPYQNKHTQGRNKAIMY